MLNAVAAAVLFKSLLLTFISKGRSEIKRRSRFYKWFQILKFYVSDELENLFLKKIRLLFSFDLERGKCISKGGRALGNQGLLRSQHMQSHAPTHARWRMHIYTLVTRIHTCTVFCTLTRSHSLSRTHSRTRAYLKSINVTEISSLIVL